MSNLGFKLLSAGFIDEAQQLCDKALAITDFHKNIPRLLGKLKDVPDEENKKLDGVLQKVKPKALFYRKTGEATAFQAPASFPHKWQSPDCVLEVAVEGTTVKMIGSYESPANTLAGLLAGGFSKAPPIQHRVEYVGELRGRAIFATVSRTRSEPQTTFGELAGNKVRVLMYFSADQRELHVMENVRSRSPSFYALKLVP
jgi:hypothetical protein